MINRGKWIAVAASCGAMAACSAQPGSAPAENTEPTGSVSQALTCPHDVLCTGGPLQGGYGSGCTTGLANAYCVQDVCNDYPSCCTTAWTNTCVQDMAHYNTAGGFDYDDCPTPHVNPAPVCTCTPTTCAAQGATCGSLSDGCGGTLNCGTCSSGQTCTNNACVAPSDGGAPTLPSPTLPPVSMSNLVFGSFGDVRPANPDDTSNYPDRIIQAIFSGLQAKGVTFAVDAGDHCFQTDTSSGAACHTQFVSHFMAALNGRYTGKLIPTLGNHEACGYSAATTGNCTSWSSGLIHDFLVDVVKPTTGQSAYPYYSVLVTGSWGTAKFVHVAANAWTTAQNNWLTNTLNVATTYTFVVRHEPAEDTRAPGVTPSQSLYSSHYANGTLTLSITGHTHLIQLPGGTQPYGNVYGATQPYEIIMGNAGAPLDAGPYYGFAMHTRRLSDGAIVTQAYEAMSSDGVTPLNNVADSSYRFAVNANGSSSSNTSLP
jgi:hypothetical protein